jgi:hypothetical protein
MELRYPLAEVMDTKLSTKGREKKERKKNRELILNQESNKLVDNPCDATKF